MNPFIEDLKLQNSEVVTLVGTGGKTTLLFLLAQLLAETRKVLVTTTTKILLPSKGSYDRLFTSLQALREGLDTQDKGIVVAGGSVNKDGKLTALEEKDLQQLLPYFDVVLIEGDGSRGKKLKAWQAYEPVVPKFTTRTIGLLPITALGLPLDEAHVYNLPKFLELAGHEKRAALETLKNVILSEQGLFQKAQREKILLINQADSFALAKQAKALADLVIKEDQKHLIGQYFILSLEELRHGNFSHYFSCRPWEKNAGRKAPLKASSDLHNRSGS